MFPVVNVVVFCFIVFVFPLFFAAQMSRLWNELKRKDVPQLGSEIRKKWDEAALASAGEKRTLKAKVLAITLLSPQLDWDDVRVIATRSATQTLGREAEESWLLEGQMEILHGVKWLRKLKKTKFFESRPCKDNPGFTEYLNKKVTNRI